MPANNHKKNPNDALHWVHPLVREWFIGKFGTPTEPQEQGWPAILANKDTLISAPTGSGKTFAAFLVCVDRIIRKALSGTLSNEIEVLYISPLKALSNDVQKNLMAPLEEIAELAKQQGLVMQEIRVAVRTGDTLAKERQAMLKKPPHILVTTPESFYILLTATKSRTLLKTVATVIVDEIHAMADDKRGTHLTLSLERLEALTQKPFVRIGLSATQKPLELVAHFLIGNDRPLPTIINIGHARHLELSVEVPGMELGAVASNEMWDEIYDRLAELSQQNRSTLIFVNTRRLAERLAHHLSERLGEDQVAAHHGSLSRKIRLTAENKLKNGELKALVATASLELGIDIGTIDLVCQIGSPRAIANALQRVGRAGHWRGAISRGKFFVTTRDELVECAALVYSIRQGELDQLIIPQEPLDILAQQIVAACVTDDWQENDLFHLVKKAYPYKNLNKETFLSIIEMLAEGIAGSRGRYGSYLFRDQVHHVIKAKRRARIVSITSGGAIPDTGLFTVVAEPDGVMVGTLDEDFAVESMRDDIILLGTTSWKIRRIENAAGRVIVEDAHGSPPSVPFWRGEAPARTKELSFQVADLREKIGEKLLPPDRTQTVQWLKNNCGVDDSGAEQLIEYIRQGKSILGAVPTQKLVIAERFFDEGGGMQLVIHAPFGARINKAWGLALRKRFCRSFNFELQAAATDNGINIALAEQHSFPLADVFHFLHPNTIREVLTQAVLQSPIFKTRWRWDASRALALIRFQNGKKVPPNIMRMLSDDLLAAVFPDAAACQDNLAGEDIKLPNHPLVNEAVKDSLTEAMDTDGLIEVIQAILNGEIQYKAVDTPVPSQFCHEILNANPYAYLDDAPLEERRARAVEMRRMLPESVLQEIGKLDPSAIVEVQEQAWPDIRNEDELHDSLQTFIAFPAERAGPDWKIFFDNLQKSQRAYSFNVGQKIFWVAAEKTLTIKVIYPDSQFPKTMIHVEPQLSEREAAIVHMLRGWLQHLGPVTEKELSELLQIDLPEIHQGLLKLESTGLILRGQYRTTQELEWCERRLLARIHRLTVGRLRKEIEPITSAQFMRWLLQWQHVAENTQLNGENGLFEVIKQLQGFELPANAWEHQIFAKRIKDYDSGLLDRLTLSGAVGWGRLSPHPATTAALHLDEEENKDSSKTKKRRISPTSVAPITFFVRETSQWMPPLSIEKREENLIALSHTAKKIYQFLKQRGASFFAEILRVAGPLKSDVEMGLWELVAAGLITADSFDNLRALISSKRRLDRKYRHLSARFSTGRWSLLYSDETINSAEHLEAVCWMLLKRYGVVFRDLLVREKNLPRWRETLITFRRLEDRGEIRGGRFIAGFLGEQFAMPYAVESLRAIRKKESSTEILTISPADPLNLIGIILPGERIPSTSTDPINLQNGMLFQ